MRNFALHANVKKLKKNNYFFLLLAIILVLCQIASFYTYSKFDTKVNQNLFFGLYGSKNFAILINVSVLSVLVYLIRLKLNKYLPLLLMTAGLVSNTIDRIFYGGVIDYITIWQIPSFNIADITIVASVIWISLILIKQKNG